MYLLYFGFLALQLLIEADFTLSKFLKLKRLTFMYVMLTELMSGLALFLFGMKFMSESLQKAAGDRLRNILNSVTKNKIVAVLFGALFTAIIQSSGATTVMEVGFVNSGVMTLEQSVGITFGANIGTTITSQLVSLKLTAVAPFIIFVGAVIIMFFKAPLARKIAEIIFGFGALFLGINFMTSALSTVQEFPELMKIFDLLNDPLISLLLGLAFTCIVQSSSVTISVLVLLADSGLVPLISCLYFILGANIGSCMPAVTASINSSRDAKRTAAIHVLFNFLGMIVISIILLFAQNQVVDLVQNLSGVGNAKRFVANADTLFKIFQTIIFLPCSKLLISLSKLIIRDKKSSGDDKSAESGSLLYIGKSNKFMETTAVVDSIHEIERMARMVRTNLYLASECLMNEDLSEADHIRERENHIDSLSHEITQFLVRANRYQLPLSDASKIGGLFKTVSDIERIGDHAVNIVEAAEKNQKMKISFTPDAKQEMRSILTNCITITDRAIDVFAAGTADTAHLDAISKLENEIDDQQREYQENHVQRMSEGKCSIEAGLNFTDLLIILERIGDHATNVAYSVIDRSAKNKDHFKYMPSDD